MANWVSVPKEDFYPRNSIYEDLEIEEGPQRLVRLEAESWVQFYIKQEVEQA